MVKRYFINSTPFHPEFNQNRMNSRNSVPFAAVLGILLFISTGQFSMAQLYQQQYNTTLANTSNASITTGTYCGSSPTSAQFNFIGSNGSGCSFEVPASTQKLTFVRTANVGIFTRSTDFSPVPSAAFYKFDLTVSGNSVAQTNAAVFQMGFSFGTAYSADNSTQSHANLGVNLSSTDGEFSLRNAANTASTANFSGTQTICWVINNTGASLTYIAPDGSSQAVADDKEDVWVGNTLAFDETAAFDPLRSLRNIKFVFNAGSAKIELDNFTVAPVPSAPVASNQVICAGTSPTVASLVATGSNLKWYSTATGGSPMISTDPVSNGTYYVSQTVAGFESVRAAVAITVSSIGISNNTISSDQTICTGTIPSSIIGTTPNITNGSGLFTYSWEVSSTSAGSGFSSIASQTGIDYSPPAPLASNRWYRRIVTADGCSQYSNVIQVTVQAAISNTITANQTICEGASPAALSGNPTGGSGVYTYSWESSTTSAISGFSALSGVTTISYTPSPLSQTTWFRRIVSSGACPDVTSSAIQITTNPPVLGNTISSDQTICTGSVPAQITGSIPTGGNGTFAYYWETSTTSPGTSGYGAASGTSQDFTPSTSLTVNRWYRRRVISGVCTTFSTPVMITVSGLLGNNTVSAAQTICSLNAPAPLTGTVPTGGIAPYAYSWESSTTSSSAGFSTISGETGAGISPGALGQNTWFRRIVTAGPCPASASPAILIALNFPVSGNDITANQTICANTAPATLNGTIPSGGNGTFAYLWEVATPPGGTFVTTSATTTSYAPGTLTADRWYRRRVTSGLCPVHYSDTVAISVTPVNTAGAASSSPTICINTPLTEITHTTTGATGIGTATGLPTGVTASWDANTITISGTPSVSGTFSYIIPLTGGCGNINATGTIRVTANNTIALSSAAGTNAQTRCINSAITSITYNTTIATGATFSGLPTGVAGVWASNVVTISGIPSVAGPFTYTITLTGGCGTVTATGTINVTPANTAGSASSSPKVCINTPIIAVTHSTTGATGIGTSTGLPAGVTASWSANTITISGTPTSSGTFNYSIPLTGGCGVVNATGTILVTASVATNTVSSNQTICSGSNGVFTGTLPTGGNGTYTYSWEVSTTSATAGFNAIVSANSQNYTSDPLSNNSWFRRVVTSDVCISTSAAVLVTVNQPILNNDASGAQALCANTVAAALTGSTPTGGNGTFAYQWESATSANGTYSNASGTSTTISYSPGTVTLSRWYRRKVTSGVCAPTFSDTIAILVTPALAGNTVSANQTICSGNNGVFTGTLPTGGNGVFTYSWEVSTTSATAGFTPIAASNTQNFTSGPLSINSWFRRVVTSDVCVLTSAAVLVTINQPILTNDITGNQALCANTIASQLTGPIPTGGTGTYLYQWESATALGGIYANASGTSTQINYSPGTVTATRWYRRRVTAGVCPVSFSDTVSITVTPAIATNTVSANQTICSGNNGVFTGSLPTGGNGIYTYSWEVSTTSATAGFSSIPTTNTQNYTSGPLTANSWFRRVINSDVCVSASGTVLVTINQPILTNDASGAQSVCANTIPAPLTGSVPTGGTGTYSYQWESSTSLAGVYSNAGGTSNQINYSPGTMTVSRWYRRRVTSGVCPFKYSDTVAITTTPVITGNTISASQNVCFSATPNPLTGTIPAGALGAFTYTWEVSTTSATAGFSTIPGENGQGLTLSPLSVTTWFRRVANSGVCTNNSAAIQISSFPAPTLDVGPAMADIVQGGISAVLGGSFGGSATGAVWSAPEGTFASNTGATPGTATYTASPISAPLITLTLTSTGSICPALSVSKTINIVPDPFGITGVINEYAEVVAPSSLTSGALKCTLATGQVSKFAKNDRALLVQMKGASVSLPGSPTDITYGYITAMGNSGNNEFINIDSIAGDVVFFQRCTKKSYTISGNVQLVRVPQYTGNYNVKSSTAVSAVRVTRKGMGYPPNTTITSGFTITPVQGGVGLTIQAKSDALGQINEIEILDGGAGYLQPPIITLPDPTVSPFDLPAYKAKALAVMGLTGKQWNGKTGGILCFEVDGNVILNDSIHMTGMGFAGGMIGDKGDVAPTCGATAEYALNFSSYKRAGQKGEGITTIPVAAMRGKGRYATGGGGGVEPEGGGGGGANWLDGGRGGSSSFIRVPNSACSTTVTPCDLDLLRGGLGAGTNPSSIKNVLRSNSYYYQPALSRFFLGGGGGGGHAFNEFSGMQSGGAGGFGGGIVILKSEKLTSNNHEILAKGENGESADGDGAGGGGAGGAVLLLVNDFVDGVNARVNGGNGGNAIPSICELSIDENAYPSRKRYSGAGGGGGGGVVWFTQPDEDVNLLAVNCNLGQSAQGNNGDVSNNTAQKGGSARSQSELVAIENIPLPGSVFTVGGSGATFPNLQKAAEFLAFKGTDAPVVTLRVTNNTSNSANLLWYKAPATFTRIYTGACTYGDATVVIQPRTTANSVNLQNEMDDLTFITLDGIPSVTIKNMLISGSYDYINTSIVVKGGSKLYLEDVNATADLKSDPTGSNEIYLKNTTHTGGIEVGANQELHLEGTITMNGITSAAPSLKFGSNSTFELPAGTTLNLNGASWINNGASSLNIDPASTLNFGGAFTNQTIGGTTPTTFQKLNILGSGTITTTSNNTVYDWNQTGSATVSTSNKILTISGKVKTSAGRFTSTGAGRVSLSGTASVDVEGRFGNLEINSSDHANLTGAVTIDNTLLLTNGKLNTGGFSLSVESTSGSSVINSPTSWVAGSLKRKVASGNSYFFPVGVNTLEKSLINVTSLSGLQYLTCSFKANDPMTHPFASIAIPFQEGSASFSALSPEGYWNITPDAGTATYDIWLFPSFYGMFPQYSIYKRPASSNEWSVFGDLSNPENTGDFVQADGSVRRTGLTGFSDFALAGGETPLPLNFLDFRVSQRRGIGKLNWKMADCLKEGKFTIFRGTSTSSMEKVGTLVVNESDCQNDFAAEDILPVNGHKFYYQISASARDEKTVVSPIKMISLGELAAEKPFLALIQNDPWRFQIMSENIEETGINIVSAEGKTIASNLKAENKILDLRSIPKGVYLVEMVNSGWSVRQRVVVGL